MKINLFSNIGSKIVTLGIFDSVLNTLWDMVMKVFYGLYFGLIKAIAWALDMLTQLFFIFAGMTPIGTNNTANADEGIDIVNFFLTQKSFQKAYLYLCLIALGLIVVFAIGKIIKQDYFDRSGPRSKAPIFRNIALSFIAFICIIPVFYFMIDAVGALALLVMKALGYKGGGLGTMLFNMCWEDGGESIRSVAIALRNHSQQPAFEWNTVIANIDTRFGSFDISSAGELYFPSDIKPSKVYDPDNFGWYSNDTFYVAFWNSETSQPTNFPIQFYWWMFLLTGPILIVNLGQMMLAMVTRLFKLVSLFVVAPSPIAQIVLDDGQKFKGWKDQVVQEALKVVGCVMSFMIFMMMASFVPQIDLMRFAYTSESASASLLESGDMTTELSNSISALYYYGDNISWVDRAINSLGRCMLLIAGVGAIKDIDGTITPLISGGKSSVDMGATGGAIASAGKTLGSGALELTKKGVGLAAAGASLAVGAVAGVGGALANGAASGVRSLAATLGAGKGNDSNNGNSTGDGNSSDGGDGGGVTPPTGGNNTPPHGSTDEEGANPGVETPTTETPEPNAGNGGGESGETGEAGVQTPGTQTPEGEKQQKDVEAEGAANPVTDGQKSNKSDGNENKDNVSNKIEKIRDKADKKVQNIRDKADKDAQKAVDEQRKKANAKKVALGVLSGVREGLVSTVKGVGGTVLKTGKSLAGTAVKSGLSMANIIGKTTASMVGWGGVYNSVTGAAQGIIHDVSDNVKAAGGHIVGAGKEMMSAGKDIADSIMYKRDANGNFIDENGDSINKDGYKVNSYGHLVDEAGKSINKDGYRIDDKGEMIKDSAGNYVKGGDPVKGGSRAQTDFANKHDSKKEKRQNKREERRQKFENKPLGQVVNKIKQGKLGRWVNTAGEVAGATIFKGTEGYMDAVRNIDENAQYNEEAKVNKIYENAEKNVAEVKSKAAKNINEVKLKREEAKIRTEKFNTAKENMAQKVEAAKQNITEGFNTVKDGVSETFEKVSHSVQEKVQTMKANAENRKQRKIEEKKQKEEQAQAATQRNFTIQEHNVGVGQDDITSGMSAISSSTSGVSEVLEGAGSVSAGVNAVVKMADETHASHGSPAGSQLESRVDAVNLARAASSFIENNDIAHSYANGVREYVAMNSDEPERIQRFTNMAKEFNGSSNSNVVTQVAAMQGIQALNAQMKTDYNKAMSNVNLSESEKNRIHFEYSQKGQQLDNAYRYVNGDTSVGREAYDAVRGQIESTKEYVNASKKKKGNYDSKSLKAADERYQKDMLARASAGETRAKEQKDSFEKTINSKMSEMSARDKVTYHQTRFECEKDRYDRASKYNDLAKMDTAQNAMKVCGQDLRSSVSDLRKKMAEEITKGAQQNIVNDQQTTQESQGQFTIQEIDVGAGHNDIISGLGFIDDETSHGMDVMMYGAGPVISGTQQVLDTASNIHKSKGSPESSELRSTANVNALAVESEKVSVDNINARLHDSEVKEFTKFVPAIQTFKRMAHDYAARKGDVVSNIASSKGIQELNSKLTADYNKSMANMNLSDEEKDQIHSDYITKGQQLDNAYRYVQGDTTVGKEAYEAVKDQIEATEKYQEASTVLGRGAGKKKVGYDAHTLMAEDAKFRKNMKDRADAGVKRASDKYNAFQTRETNEVNKMSSYDKVAYYKEKFNNVSDRYEQSMNSNDKARMNAAQFDMRTCGDDLRYSVSDLRKKMTEEVNKKND